MGWLNCKKIWKCLPLFCLVVVLIAGLPGAHMRVFAQIAPAPKPAPARTRLPDPGRFDPYPEYLDNNSAAITNFRIYSPQRKTSGFDTIRALREEREKRLRARPAWLGGPGAGVPVRQETVYSPATSARTKPPAPAAPAIPPPPSKR